MARIYRVLERVPNQVSQSAPELIPSHEVEIDKRVKVVQDTYWVEVSRVEQVLYLYFNYEIVKAWRVSTGRLGRPGLKSRATRPGVYCVYNLYKNYPMWGVENKDYGWWAPSVPWVVWFHGELAIHTAYWHNDFGKPVSHGCVNMAEVDAEELYPLMVKGRYGTVVWVH